MGKIFCIDESGGTPHEPVAVEYGYFSILASTPVAIEMEYGRSMRANDSRKDGPIYFADQNQELLGEAVSDKHQACVEWLYT